MAREQRLVEVRRALLECEADRAEDILSDLEYWAPAAGGDPLEETEHATATQCSDLERAEAAVLACFPDRADAILSELRALAAARIAAVAGQLEAKPLKSRRRASAALGSSGDVEAIVPVWRALDDAGVKTRLSLSSALARLVVTIRAGERPPEGAEPSAVLAKLIRESNPDRTLVKALAEIGARAVLPLAGLLVEPAIDGFSRLQIVSYFRSHPDARANDALLATHPIIHPGGNYQLFALEAVARTGDARAAAPLIACTRLDGRHARPLPALKGLLESSARRIAEEDLRALASLDGLTRSIYVDDDMPGMFDSHRYEGEEPVDTSEIRALAAAEITLRAGRR